MPTVKQDGMGRAQAESTRKTQESGVGLKSALEDVLYKARCLWLAKASTTKLLEGYL